MAETRTRTDTRLDLDLHVPGETATQRTRIVLGEAIDKSKKVHFIESIGPSPFSRSTLAFPEGVALVLKEGIESGTMTARREAGLEAVRKQAARDRKSMAGIVPMYAMATVRGTTETRYAKSADQVLDPVQAFDVMPYAGLDLKAVIEKHGPAFWGAGGHQAAVAAMLAPARTLRELHRLGDSEGKVFAHRDIKPSNLFVLAPGQVGFAKAARAVGGWPDMPLVRVGDMGLLYFSSTDPDGTTTHLRPRSGYWSAPEDWRRASQKVPRLLDTWAFAATLFFVLTGQHPWATVEASRHTGLEPVEAADYMWHQSVPDNDLFSQIDPDLAEVIRGCLAPVIDRRPLDDLVSAMEIYAADELQAAADRATAKALKPKPAAVLKPASARKLKLPGHRPAEIPLRDLGIGLAAIFAIGACVLALIVNTGAQAAGGSLLQRAWADFSQAVQYGDAATPARDLIQNGYTERGHGIFTKGDPTQCTSGPTACGKISYQTVLADPNGEGDPWTVGAGPEYSNGACRRGAWLTAALADKDGNVVDAVPVVLDPNDLLGPKKDVTVVFPRAKPAAGQHIVFSLAECKP